MTEALLGALSHVMDPEMPVNIVDLGLIYGVQQQGGTVSVELTLTAMGCPAVEFILDDIRQCLLAQPGVSEVCIRIVWDPAWSVDRLTPAGREALQMWGLAL